ncbi:type IV pilus assembly protein PilV [Alkalispirillum mobile]|uniref:Type IV pilus assembly protein PilV n=1 Tax=Alkalispirillum mobile TaxID=85925 RepID=A0A498C025_9GAMM|nr:type IV pilus assembly protein PilV [Alkalispirillum mobile]
MTKQPDTYMPRVTKSITASERSSGFSLLEVLIAVVVLSIGLLGLATLQATSLGFNHEAYTRSQATLTAYDITDRMRANREAAEDGHYDLTFESRDCLAANPGSNITTGDALATNDLRSWIEKVCELPADDSSEVQAQVGPCNGGDMVCVTVTWHDRNPDDPDNPRAVSTVSMATEI